MRKAVVPVLMVLLAAAGITSIYAWQQLRDVRAQAAELGARMSAVQSPASVAGMQPATPGVAAGTTPSPAELPAGAAAGTVAASPTAVAAPGPGRSGQAGSKPDPLQSLAQQMLSTPEGQEMLKAQLRAILPMQFPDIGKELGLSPEETEKLMDMLVKHQLSVTGDALDILGGNGAQDAAAVQESRRKVQEQQRANQAELAALLGDKMPRYETYQRTLPLRQQVNQLRAALGSGNNALGEAEGRQLVSALAAEQALIQRDRQNAPRPPQQTPPNAQALMEQQLQRAAEDNRRMVEAARSHLNAQQLEAYRQMLEQQQSLQRSVMRLGAQQGTGNNVPPPAPTPAPK